MKRPRFEENRDFYSAIGRRIAEKRRGRLTQEDLAKRLFLTRTSIINIEKGRQQILVHTLVDIARILDVPPGDLLPDDSGILERLRDTPQEGRKWIMRSRTQTNKGE